MSNSDGSIVRSTVIKGGAGARITAAVRDGIIDTFDPASVQIMRNPAGAAETARIAGFDQGYKEGLTQARSDVVKATEDSNKRVRRALASLAEAVDIFDKRQTVALVDVEDAIVAAAFEIARNILQRELVVAEDPGGDALARVLAFVPDRGNVIARMHPDDLATLNTDRLASMTRTVHLTADSNVELGGCIVEVGDLRIDGQLSSALDHVRQALALDPEALPSGAPLINGVVEVARANAAVAAQEFSRSVDTESVTTTEEVDAAKNKIAVAGRNRKSSRKTALEAPNT